MSRAVALLEQMKKESINQKNCFLGVLKDPKAKPEKIHKRIKRLDLRISQIDMALEEIGSGK